MLSASRQIATRRLLPCFSGSDCVETLLCENRRSRSETCIHVLLRQTGTLTQNITTIESTFRGVRLRTMVYWLQSDLSTKGVHKRACQMTPLTTSHATALSELLTWKRFRAVELVAKLRVVSVDAKQVRPGMFRSGENTQHVPCRPE